MAVSAVSSTKRVFGTMDAFTQGSQMVVESTFSNLLRCGDGIIGKEKLAEYMVIIEIGRLSRLDVMINVV
jgi:hypothetical protein